MALFTTILLALSPLIQPVDPVPKVPEPVVSSPTPGGAASQAGRALPIPSLAPPESTALASWYPRRPSACWDARGRHSLPLGPDGQPITEYTAHLTLPCGTLIQLTGPQGSITVPVEDHGPEAWTKRILDLSPDAFRKVAGSLDVGVIPVEWRPAA